MHNANYISKFAFIEVTKMISIENPNEKLETLRPVLRWAGSKKKLLPLLCAATPRKIRRYIEPFAGSSILSLRVKAKFRLLNDLNTDLIDSYRVLQKRPKQLWECLSSFPESPEFYYEIRALKSEDLSAFERAARFIYLNRFCFNGVYRTNRLGQFNVSRGIGDLKIPSLQVFENFATHLRSADLMSEDFSTPARAAGKNDFLYLDPPYALGEKRDRGEYGCDSFKQCDENRLIKEMKAASARGANVLLSYSPSDKVLNSLSGWSIKRIEVNRHVAGFVDSRRIASEVLVSNYTWEYPKNIVKK
jgi:DNA adenine methylase